MEYAIKMSTRSSCKGPPGWKIFSSGNVDLTSRRIASNHAPSLFGPSLPGRETRASTSLALCKAFLYVSSVNIRSLPIALGQTRALDLGATPLHQSSRVRGSRITCSQFGRTCSSQIRRRALLVSSLAHWEWTTLSAFLRSNRHFVSRRSIPATDCSHQLPS